MKIIYQHNDTYNEQKVFISRKWKKNKQTLAIIFLEICFFIFFFNLNVTIHQYLQRRKKNTPVELCQYRMILKCIFRGNSDIIYTSCVDAECSD